MSQAFAAKISPKCLNAGTESIRPADSQDLIRVNAKGFLLFYCNGGQLDSKNGVNWNAAELDDVQLTSPDGRYNGTHYYEYATGIPTWEIFDVRKNRTRIITAEKKPQARKTAPNGSSVSWSRRAVIDDSGLPKARYVLRSNTTSGKKPTSINCNGDQGELGWNNISLLPLKFLPAQELISKMNDRAYQLAIYNSECFFGDCRY